MVTGKSRQKWPVPFRMTASSGRISKGVWPASSRNWSNRAMKSVCLEQVEQVLEAIDHEVGRLKIVDVIAGAQDALEIEGQIVGGGIFRHIFRLAEG